MIKTLKNDKRLTLHLAGFWWTFPGQIVVNCLTLLLLCLVIQQLLNWPTYWLWVILAAGVAFNGLMTWGWFHDQGILISLVDAEVIPEVGAGDESDKGDKKEEKEVETEALTAKGETHA